MTEISAVPTTSGQGEVLFRLEDGSPVYGGDTLHVAPEYLRKAGAVVTAAFRCDHVAAIEVTVRSKNGAVPTIPIKALSREPHPHTIIVSEISAATGIMMSDVSNRDIRVWKAAIASIKIEQVQQG